VKNKSTNQNGLSVLLFNILFCLVLTILVFPRIIIAFEKITPSDQKMADSVFDLLEKLKQNSNCQETLKISNKIKFDKKNSLTWLPYINLVKNTERICKHNQLNQLNKLCQQVQVESQTENIKTNSSLNLYLYENTLNYCYGRILEKLTIEMKNKSKIKTEEIKILIQENFTHFVKLKDVSDFQRFIKLSLQNKDISEITLSLFIKEVESLKELNEHRKYLNLINYIPDLQISSSKTLRDLNSNLLKSSKMSLKFGELLKNFKLVVKKYDDSDIKIPNSALEILAYFKLNSDDLKKKETLEDLIYCSRILLQNNQTELGRDFLRIAIQYFEGFPERWDAVFTLISSHIKFSEFNQIKEFIYSHKLDSKLYQSPSYIQFWSAYSFEKIKLISEANSLYENILKTHPVTVYAAFSLNKLKNSKVKDEYLKIFHSKKENKNIYSEHFKEIIKNGKPIQKRIVLWGKINSIRLMEIELKDYISQTNSKEQNTSLIIELTKSLQFENLYQKSFNIIQKKMDEGQIELNRELLTQFFPKIYFNGILDNEYKINPHVIISLIKQESAFSKSAISSAGARGLMQIMFPTAKRFSKKIKKQQLFIPSKNIPIGLKYLDILLKKFDGNLIYTIASYNAGEGNVDKWRIKHFNGKNILHDIENIPFKETRIYVKSILRNYFFYEELYKEKSRSPASESINYKNLFILKDY
jgi:soluble lytic murein transglycosylase